MYNTRPPEEGPWLVRPDQATGKYVSTPSGPAPIADHFPKNKLRPDQFSPKAKFNPGHHVG